MQPELLSCLTLSCLPAGVAGARSAADAYIPIRRPADYIIRSLLDQHLAFAVEDAYVDHHAVCILRQWLSPLRGKSRMFSVNGIQIYYFCHKYTSLSSFIRKSFAFPVLTQLM